MIRNLVLAAICSAIGVQSSSAFAATWDDAVTNLAPVGWWRLNEDSGSSASDTGSAGNVGTYLGSPLLDQSPAFGAPINRSVDFSDGHVQIGNVLDFGTGDFTLMAWFKKTSSSTEPMKLINKGLALAGTPQNAGYQIRIRDGILETGVGDETGGIFDIEVPEPTLDEWHFVASVIDRSANQIRLYLDPATDLANAVGSLPVGFGSVDTNIPVAMGALDRGDFGDVSEFFGGFIDEAVIFDKALTGSEIRAAYSSAVPEPGMLGLS